MSGASTLHFAQPLWLLLALLPWLLRAWQRRHARSPRLTAFADAHLLPRLLVGRPAAAQGAVLATAWSLAALAAAGPYWAEHATPAEVAGADIAVVVDISQSMAVADLAPDRLTRVKHELHDFVRLLGGDRLALVVFSGNAYTVLPLTSDRDAFLQFVGSLEPGLTTRAGSNLTRAADAAVRALEHSARGSRAIVLISDGEFHDAELASATAAVRTQAIPVFGIGAATAGGGPVPDEQGHFLRYENAVVISRLDRARLQQLARDSGGAYVDLRDDDGEWTTLLAALRARTQETVHASAAPSAAGAVALYPWPLAASLVLFLWTGTRRRDVLIMMLLPLLWTPPPVDAAPWTEREAYAALQAGDYRTAQRLYAKIDSYSGALGTGTAAYHLKDWNAALAAYERAVRSAADEESKAQALYNVGNVLARLARYDEAGARYRSALQLQPNFSKAGFNLTLVNQLLEQRRGLRTREDSKRSLPAGTAAPRADDGRADGHGGDREQAPAGSPIPQGNAAEKQQRSAAREQITGPGDRSAPQAAELQQTLTLWRDAAARGGPAELDSLRDGNTEFLRWRFREDDLGKHVKKTEDKPW